MVSLELELLKAAQDEARRYGHPYVRSEHLFLALLNRADEALLADLKRAGIHYDAVAAALRSLARPVCAAEETLLLARGAQRVVDQAAEMAGGEPHPRDLLLALLMGAPLLTRILETIGADRTIILHDLQNAGGEYGEG